MQKGLCQWSKHSFRLIRLQWLIEVHVELISLEERKENHKVPNLDSFWCLISKLLRLSEIQAGFIHLWRSIFDLTQQWYGYGYYRANECIVDRILSMNRLLVLVMPVYLYASENLRSFFFISVAKYCSSVRSKQSRQSFPRNTWGTC